MQIPKPFDTAFWVVLGIAVALALLSILITVFYKVQGKAVPQ